MRSATLASVALVLVLTGCSAAPGTWTMGPTIGPSASDPAITPGPTTPGTGAPSPATPSPIAEPTPMLGLPDGIGAYAWAVTEPVMNAEGETTGWRLRFGPIGGGASTTVTSGIEAGFVRAAVGGSMVVVARMPEVAAPADAVTELEAFRLPGTSVLRATLRTPWLQRIVVDDERSTIYAAANQAAGGVHIVRISTSGEPVTLIRLDERFTPDGIPTERFDLTLTPAGDLVVLACASSEPCRLWRVPPDASTADPIDLDPAMPIVCSAIGATERVLVVYDDAACWADYDDAPVPIRAVDLATGVTRELHEGSNFWAARVVEVGDHTEVVGRVRRPGGAVSDIVAIDVADATRRTVLADVPLDIGADGVQAGQIVVSDSRLPGDWVLVLHGFRLPSDAIADPLAPFLLRIGDGEVVTLPARTSGD